MKNKKSDFDLVKEHLNYINNRSWQMNILSSINIPKTNKDRNEWTIGNSIFIDDDNFEQQIEKILDDESYFIAFNDGGIIHLAYSFDSNGVIKKHTLFFINVFNVSAYLRLDYSLAEANHYKSHMHTSIKNSKDPFEFRIPVDSPVYPRTFLLFVLKNYYDFDCKNVDDFKKIKINSIEEMEKLDIPHLKFH